MRMDRQKIGLRSRIVAQVGTWWRRTAELEQLRMLDDHLLKDAGLSHDDIARLRRSQWW